MKIAAKLAIGWALLCLGFVAGWYLHRRQGDAVVDAQRELALQHLRDSERLLVFCRQPTISCDSRIRVELELHYVKTITNAWASHALTGDARVRDTICESVARASVTGKATSEGLGLFTRKLACEGSP
jgi:hypothetical protein